MPSSTPDYLSFACPQCHKKLRAPIALASQQLNCPKCSASIRVPDLGQEHDHRTDHRSADHRPAESTPKVPANSLPQSSDVDSIPLASSENSPKPKSMAPRRSVFDDDPPDLLPLHEESKNSASQPQPSEPQHTSSNGRTASKGASVKQNDPFLTDAQKEALEQTSHTATSAGSSPSTARSKTTTISTADDLRLESSALGDDFAIPQDDEFRFTCRICGSLLSANRSRIGSRTRCPDCYSEFLIPKPVEKRKAPDVKLDENISVKLQPIDSRSSRVQYDVNQSTKDILSKAAVEADREREEIERINYAFDTNRWLVLIFGFLRDPMVIVAAAGLGMITCIWLVAMDSIGTTIRLSPVLTVVLRALLFGIFIPIGGTIFLCGIAILTMSANRSTRVSDWPFSKISDSISEGFVVLAAFLMASLPGGIVGTMVSSLGAQTGVFTGMALVSIWGFFPIILLSMINNSSVFEPYSKSVVETMKTHGDAWGAMYIQSGLAFLFLFALCVLTLLRGIAGEIICGLLLPLSTFFVFNQYGVLAGRISQATELGFHGDFSDD